MPFGAYESAIKIAAAMLLVLSAFFYGQHVQRGFDAEAQLKAVAAQKALTDEKQLQVNRWAEDFSRLRADSDNSAVAIRKRLGELNGKLSTCNGSVAALNSNFRVLYNAAITGNSGDRPESASDAAGASVAITPEAVVEVTIENGKRWKQCRDQLNGLIQSVK